MDDKTKETAKIILAEVASAREYSKVPDSHSLFISAETIISAMAYLIGPLMDAETAYRSQIVQFTSEGISNAAAEAKAKAGPEYAEWRKLERVYTIGDDQVKLIKKFSDKLDLEFKRS